EKAYLEAQKLIGQRGQQRSDEKAPPEPAPLSREQAIEHYGDSIVAAAEEAGIDLGAWDQAVRRGEDTAELRQKLSQQTGIPAQLIEQYEAAYRPQPKAADGGAQGLTDADVVEIKAAVGGDEEFARLSQWAATNLQPAELSAYNQAVDAGNRQAVQAFLWGMQARANGGATTREPELIGGGRPPQAARFETQEQALEAMRKTNENGKRLYNVDPKYRAWYEKTLARSTFSA
ncbi:MAG: uncultured phage MedDCM-OCT-S37-C6, partial [Cyanobacteriota bacterium]